MNEISFETLRPQRGDIIVGRYRLYSLDARSLKGLYDSLKGLYDSLKDTFPDNQVLLIPDAVSISAMEKDHLLQIGRQIMEIAEKEREG